MGAHPARRLPLEAPLAQSPSTVIPPGHIKEAFFLFFSFFLFLLARAQARPSAHARAQPVEQRKSEQARGARWQERRAVKANTRLDNS